MIVHERNGSRLSRFVRAFLILAALAGCAPSGPAEVDELSGRPEPPGRAERYVDDARCGQCHAEQFDQWSGSHHDLAMQEASASSVLGDFGDASFTAFGVTTRFFTEAGRFFVNTEDVTGRMADFEVAYTFGAEPLQQYLIEFPGGRLQALSIAWDTTRGRWFHLYADQRIPPGDALHWTGRLQNWNLMCAECHSTNLEKNFDIGDGGYETRWSAIDVGCQACHGPGAAHVEWAEAPRPGNVTADGPGLPRLGLLSARSQIETCAPCHSRRSRVDKRNDWGEPFLDRFEPELLGEGLYYPDGQIQDEVYVYGSFLQSRMYQAGVVCGDCHDAHTLELRAVGNELCVRCHNAAAPVGRFPSIVPKEYDSSLHHFHPEDSPGARCVNCHMAQRTYMVVDPRRDHSFRVPRPDLSVELETPNTCNACHTDRSAAWAARAVADWYGPVRRPASHYGAALAAGRRRDADAVGPLVELAGGNSEPAIVRATALELLASYGVGARGAFAAGLRDSEALVRRAAVSPLAAFGPDDRRTLLVPLLSDPVRAVRLEAARVLAPEAGTLGPADALLTALLSEYEDLQLSFGDTPEGQMNLGLLHSARGDRTRAVEDYRRALDLDSAFVPASENLATLLDGLGRSDEAEAVLLDAIQENPDSGDLLYSLGLVRAEDNRLSLAVDDLERAVELLPGRPRIRYNFALALQRLGRRREAEAELLEAYRIGPDDPDVAQALAILYTQDGRSADAVRWTREWMRLRPGQPGPPEPLERMGR